MTALRHIAAAEWARLWTVRSTWWFVLCTVAVGLGFGLLLGLDAASGPSDEPATGAWAGGRLACMFILFGLLATAVATTTGDHVTGGIVPTLQWTPRRGILLAARSSVIVATLTALGLLLVAGASVVVRVLAPSFDLTADDGLTVLGELFVVIAPATLLAVAVGLLTRSTAGGLVLTFALILVLPLLLGNIPFEAAQRVYEVLPGTGVVFLVFGEGPDGMTTARARALLLGWTAALALAGSWRLLRTDADR